MPCAEVQSGSDVFELFIQRIKNKEMKNSLEGDVKAELKNVNLHC